MSLTVNSNPNNIDNSGAYNVTTSLTEDGDHVNLRVRADITIDAVVVTTIEKPKGLADFDFFDILKSHVTGISFARNSGVVYKVSGGSPLIAYTILFTEVYEDADGATQTGDTDNASGTTYYFVPAVGDDKAFSNYVLSTSISLFANKTLRNNVVKFYPAYEYWLVFFTEIGTVQLFYSKDGGAYDDSITFDPTNNWGVIVINIQGLMADVTSNLRIQIGEDGGDKISEVITIYIDSGIIDERVVLEYDGYVGGKEYLAFEGIKLQEFRSIRNYYTGILKNRKPLSLFGMNRQRLETRFKDINNAEYLKSLLMSETVKKLEPLFVDPSDVTIITDNVKIAASDMFTNEIDIEYSNDPTATDLFTLVLESTGTGAGVITFKLKVAESIVLTLDGEGKFYDDLAATVNEGTTRTITAGALRTVYIKVASGTSNLTFSNELAVIMIGETATNGWLSPANGPMVNISKISKMLNLTNITLTSGSTRVVGDFSGCYTLTQLTFLNIGSNTIDFDYIRTWPALNMGIYCYLNYNAMTATQVDNALIAFASGPFASTTINLAGTNAARTSVSDAAVAILEAAGCTIVTT